MSSILMKTVADEETQIHASGSQSLFVKMYRTLRMRLGDELTSGNDNKKTNETTKNYTVQDVDALNTENKRRAPAAQLPTANSTSNRKQVRNERFL